ncbi:uncharacterized protein LACBIDRAFT_329590 [Laccaria bicolor S238N-H82]|uniref:Predicted protein n=1 Tax=Laccaria bicolor (strain S238N-H82 / ATCC MYA-4686) TaxID=486041 RepID=B0DIH9_LACBS|nr:uncharacterized protein LACBIDRAFT_329590 [Laccaria bicolor S238N-H82]EDR05691.1 predicted protein [Laccaria bicolor S238N-H82]|eukprot:XP_001883795.1 predicted protein [Laccaria bicolor S238N-H82]
MVFHADHATLGLAHTNIKIPGHASFSSAGSCLQWTADGQLLVVTKDAIHILVKFRFGQTPENAHDTSHPHLKLADKSIAWAQTIIEFDQINIRKWPDRSQEWGAAALGSLDTGLRAVARSPSKLMAGSGGFYLWKRCVVAVLSSNFDLSLWASSKNRYKGRWNKIQDVTSWLELQLSARSSQSRSEETIQAQVTCEIQLAYGTADGEVGVVTITQALEAIPTVSIFGPTYNLTASFGNQTETVTGADKRGLTTLAWIRADKNVKRFLATLAGQLLLVTFTVQSFQYSVVLYLSEPSSKNPLWPTEIPFLGSRHSMSMGILLGFKTSFWKYPEIHGLEDELRQVLTTSRAGYSPVHLLRPFFTRLPHCPELQSRVPALLDSTPESLQGLTGALPTAKATCHDPLDFPSLERNFRESLTNQLFGHDILLRLRIKLYTAEFLGKITANAQIRAECDHAVSKLLFDISKITLQILVRHLNLVFAVLKAEDLAFASRVAEQASLPGRFPELVEEVQQLSDAINNFKCSLDQEHVDKVQELCPACCSEVLMGSATTNGTCANGHQWGKLMQLWSLHAEAHLNGPDLPGRCSITSFLLSTPHLRTCVGCSRKALLPAASSPANVIQPEQARSWVVQAFLEASTWCLLCGNNFACVY